MRLFIKGKKTEKSDSDLLEEYRRSGNKDCVGELFTRYSHLVYGVCLNFFPDKDESKDLVMKIFEKLYSELSKREIHNFKGWLTFVARNFCISELRKRSNNKYEDLSDDISENSDQENLHEKEDDLNLLEKSIAELKPEQRICVELFFIKEKSYKEISAVTGFSESKVKSHIQNGKRNLKILMAEMKLNALVNKS